MKIAAIISYLESIAAPALQEQYDNAGLLTGNADWECQGIICCLDATEAVVKEAIERKCNLIVAHHPIIFGGLKKINGKNYVEKTVISAIKNDVAIYAIHTNLDNRINGVNGKIADLLDLQDRSVMLPKENSLRKLITFVPTQHSSQVRDAIFQAGAGQIGQYSECSFNSPGTGTFKALEGAQPFVGNIGERHEEQEIKIEAVFPSHIQLQLVNAMIKAHPYEMPAYDILPLMNEEAGTGSGIIGNLENAIDERKFLELVKSVFGMPTLRHTKLTGKKIKSVAICGGAGSFLISKALGSGADVFVTADMKYHEFFDANERILIIDIGHYESEQFTIELLAELLEQKFPTFAVLKTAVITNPVYYF